MTCNLYAYHGKLGVSALQDQAQHFDLGVVMLASNTSTSTTPTPHLRFRGISTTTYRLPSRFKYVDDVFPLPQALASQKIRLQIEALNTTHYAFSAGRGGCEEETQMQVYGYARGNYLVPYYSGVVVGAYATSNGRWGEGAFRVYVGRWRYWGLEQVREFPSGQAVVWD